MIVNNLLLRLKNRDADSIKKTQDLLLGMKGKIEVLLDLQAETNIRQGHSAYDIMLITKFKSMEDMETYLAHPVHLEAAQYIVSVLDAQASVCFEIKAE